MLGKDLNNIYLQEIMKPPLPIVSPETNLEALTEVLTKQSQAVLVKLGEKEYQILTKYDLIHTLL